MLLLGVEHGLLLWMHGGGCNDVIVIVYWCTNVDVILLILLLRHWIVGVTTGGCAVITRRRARAILFVFASLFESVEALHFTYITEPLLTVVIFIVVVVVVVVGGGGRGLLEFDPDIAVVIVSLDGVVHCNVNGCFIN